MPNSRLEFYDPLYETITFEKDLPSSRTSFSRHEDPLDPRDIIQTAEFARLAHLRQTGLGWLVFPSATHTRFAHSIGCWWLGRMAESLIRVRGRLKGMDKELRLHSWLKGAGLREEFYLGLLFHDVGHAPLSHVLERNPEFTEGLREAKLVDVDHEHRGAALFEEENPLAQKWRQVASQRYGKDIKTLVDIKKIFDKRLKKVCIPAILYLMTGDQRFTSQCSHDHRTFLCVLHELVSGLLDLDRLDHYARDSYFSGLRQVSVNVRVFLNNLCLTYENDKSKTTRLSLSEGGITNAASLLFGKRQITTTMLRNHRVVALESMVNWALSAHIKQLGGATERIDTCLRIALMEDAEFLDTISTSPHEGCRSMSQRIRAVRPYQYIGRWPNTVHREQLETKLAEYVRRSEQDGVPTVLARFDDRFSEPPGAGRDWLDTGRLLIGDSGQFLTEHLEHKDHFVFLRDADRIKYLWVFAIDGADSRKIEGEITELLGYTPFGMGVHGQSQASSS